MNRRIFFVNGGEIDGGKKKIHFDIIILDENEIHKAWLIIQKKEGEKKREILMINNSNNNNNMNEWMNEWR